MQQIDFRNIAPRCGSPHNAFEELCCQLARKIAAPESRFDRFRGAGGDGGVECIERTCDGRVIGWQAKFLFDVGSLIKDSDKSLATALNIHQGLSEFVLCYPFNPTGPTGRKKKTGAKASCELEKLEQWIRRRQDEANAQGRRLTIKLRPQSDIEALLFEHDPKGGMREYFFNSTILSSDWFRRHLEGAIKSVGPRYSSKLTVVTPLHKWFDAFGGGDSWTTQFQSQIVRGQEALDELEETILAAKANTSSDSEILEAKRRCLCCLKMAKSALATPTAQLWTELVNSIGLLLKERPKFGFLKPRSRTAPFWSSPVSPALDALQKWLLSPVGKLGFHRAFVLKGEGGSGKTHAICDMALQRLDQSIYSCVVFGHQFGGHSTEWVRFAEVLGLPGSLGQDALLDALNSAAEASGKPLIIWVDALNEVEPRDYWNKRLSRFVEHIVARPELRICVSCRSSFAKICLPAGHGYPEFEHRGFEGREHVACKAFFEYYGLVPPLAPILQPELGNPLYLKLVCSTLQRRSLERLPPGWLGVTQVMRAFIEVHEKAFAFDHQHLEGVGVVSKSLHAIASSIAAKGESFIALSEAITVVNHRCPEATQSGVVRWLIRADLLIEEGITGYGLESFGTAVRLAFERLSDFLIASEIMPSYDCHDPRQALRQSKRLGVIFESSQSVDLNAGWVSALCLLFAERWGVELPSVVDDEDVRKTVLLIAMESLAWRAPDEYNTHTVEMVRSAMASGTYGMKDALLKVATQPSRIDAKWLTQELAAMPIWQRDPMWSAYILQAYESRNSSLTTLIQIAHSEDVRLMDGEIVIRWALLLCWFTAAADRRVKDSATRALTRLFCAHPKIMQNIIVAFHDSDDDDLIERGMVAAYGALLIVRDIPVTQALAGSLLHRYSERPQSFQNAQIRDLIRCIGELAEHLGCLPSGLDPLVPTKRQNIRWTPELPSEIEMALWLDWKRRGSAFQKAAQSCANDDFNHYTIGCLHPWMRNMNKIAIGKWLTKHLADEFHLASEAFNEYEEKLSAYGWGRSRSVWAERIGKKYQWIALNRLASRLHDSYDRETQSWDSVRLPLILDDERKLDPSIPTPKLPTVNRHKCWWTPAQVNLDITKEMKFSEWAKSRGDLPSMEALLSSIEHSGQQWRTLHTMQSWSEYSDRLGHSDPYRFAWLHLRSYLVIPSQFMDVLAAIGERNYFQSWLPEGGRWIYGFLGEYPWGTTFNTEPDSYMEAGPELRNTNLTLIHTANVVNCEWEYDGTLEHSIQFLVPAKQFFKRSLLNWDGRDGFRDGKGKTIFRDPHGTEGGPSALIADSEILPTFLKKLGYRLVWTLLGGKDILGQDQSDRISTEVYSQFAYLDEAGEAIITPRRFYQDNQRNIGPDPAFLPFKQSES